MQSASVVKALLLVAYLRQPGVRSRALTREERRQLVRDISERKRQEDELRSSRVRLVRAGDEARRRLNPAQAELVDRLWDRGRVSLRARLARVSAKRWQIAQCAIGSPPP